MDPNKQEFLNYLLNKMSLTEKIDQMIMIDYRETKEMTIDLEKALSIYKPPSLTVIN